MKNNFKLLFALLLFFTGVIHAQVGIGTATPDGSAALDVKSTDKGFLLPRMTTTQRTAIGSPAAGLQVFDTDTNSNWFYNGSTWVNALSTTISGTAPIDVTAGVVSLNDAGVTTAKIADNAVTIAKLPTGATTTTYLKGDGTWANPVTKGLVNCLGTISQTITDANVTATATITVTYEDTSGDIIYTTIKNRVVGTSFTIQFGAIPSTSAKINYTIVQ